MARPLFILIVLSLIAVTLPATAGAINFESYSEEAVSAQGAHEGESATFGFESGLKASCKKSGLSGTVSPPSETLTLTPTFSECTAFGFISATVSSGCKFVYRIGEEVAEEEFAGTADLSCEGGAILITAATCKIQIGTQAGLGTVTYVDEPEATPENMRVVDSLTKVAYTKTMDGIGCPLSGTGSKEDGTFSDQFAISGTSGGESVSLRAGKPVIEFWPKATVVKITVGGTAEIKVKNTREFAVNILFNAPEALPFTGPEAGSNCGAALAAGAECKDIIGVAPGAGVGVAGKLRVRVERGGWTRSYRKKLLTK
jgi:hypothetical protein